MPDTGPLPSTDKPLSRLDDLALFGAPPLFGTPRHVNRPQAPERAVFDALMDDVWQRRWFTNDGPLVQELERRLSDWLDVPHAVLTCNATIALDLVMQGLGIEGEVLLPSYTFISTAHMLTLRGLTPVFCEVGPDMLLDPEDCAARITPRTGAVVATHVWGSPCDIDGLQALCDEAGIPLIFDAAHAFGGRYKEHRIGRFGAAEIFSLHATKAFHACEGGLVTTCDGDLAARLRLTRNFGFSGSDRVECAGINAKMSELHAAMGLCNLDVFEQTRAAARAIHAGYRDGLAGVAGITLKCPAPEEDNNHHYVVCEIDESALGLSRDALLSVLSAENVFARRYFFPGGHRSPPHLARTEASGLSLPRTDAFCGRVLLLPGGSAAQPDEVARICTLIRFAAAQAEAIRDRL
ncbi:DegT/DnrJ/EryC1/StrS family aminotransferase [Primorskyibacter sp. 2E107]|uniref:DegT/DnrJ/EryC1/StrS family aminotransferase n=1 Tax=Primorskyibacter sp. 2E107 TaxID=3403458 RepID=UPI003AF436D6